jgi:D-arabinan exo alpha-(1,3)/(1,5)-arabinofuranosidase (non-reducing end)
VPFMSLLESLPYATGNETRQISAENPSGEKGGACRETPDPSNPDLFHSKFAVDLGRGWKVRPFIRLGAGTTVTLADVDGPGCINHFFITSDLPNYSELVLRLYWDHEELPSVESPLGAFFAMGHDSAPHTVESMPVTVVNFRGCNSYWQMPFRKHARITLTNEGPKDAEIVAYKILYKLLDVSQDAAYFHAQYRRAVTSRERPEHVILDGVQGKGAYVGTYLAWNSLASGWWGEGEVKFYLDGDIEFPSMADNGTEDYFGGAWGFLPVSPGQPGDVEQVFSTNFLGMPLAKTTNISGPRKYSLYRWHIMDSIGFKSDIKVTVQALGWWPNAKYQPLADDIASVAYWYQSEPHASFPRLLPVEGRWDR